MAPVRVAVCIITYRRPDGLRRALDAVAAQVFDGARPDLRVLIVDNDEAGSARQVCDALFRAEIFAGRPVRREVRGVSAHARLLAARRHISSCDRCASTMRSVV